jgi:hypothetical protein
MQCLLFDRKYFLINGAHVPMNCHVVSRKTKNPFSLHPPARQKIGFKSQKANTAASLVKLSPPVKSILGFFI